MTDEELMAAVCTGDGNAYQSIVRRHLNSIGYYAFRLLGNKADAEDITQETFLRLWMHAGKWDPGQSRLSTWLHRITHNLCMDRIRKRDRLQTNPDPEAPADTITGADAETDRRMQQLQLALAQLPEAQRSAVMLCHHSGFSNREAAAIMNISVKALESTLTRARGNLRALLNPD